MDPDELAPVRVAVALSESVDSAASCFIVNRDGFEKRPSGQDDSGFRLVSVLVYKAHPTVKGKFDLTGVGGGTLTPTGSRGS